MSNTKRPKHFLSLTKQEEVQNTRLYIFDDLAPTQLTQNTDSKSFNHLYTGRSNSSSSSNGFTISRRFRCCNNRRGSFFLNRFHGALLFPIIIIHLLLPALQTAKGNISPENTHKKPLVDLIFSAGLQKISFTNA